METERQKVIDTGGIPQCPYCKKPTKRTGGGGSVTCMYYPPVYDEQGNNTNPDRNTRTSVWECLECKNHYTTDGNYTDGFYYGALAGV
jgi:ribosomal protein L37AE/L43A